MKHKKIAGQLTYQDQNVGEVVYADAEYILQTMAHDKIVSMEKELGDAFKDFFPTQIPGWRLKITYPD